MKKILVTGGCGYIGSHTIVDLIEHGFDVISADNNSRSDARILQGVASIIGKEIKNYSVDLSVFDDTHAIFQENPDITGIIHFAAYKAVGESVENPLLYFDNNLNSLINILRCATEFGIRDFVFSSSCTVYGEPDQSPVTEATPWKPAVSPYGLTKQMGEQIIEHTLPSSSLRAIALRYFNPVGAHPSIAIGEMPIGKPANLVPAITQTAIGKIPMMQVFGNDYDTRDGSCIRDYIHVCDIAHAHTQALQYLEKKNLLTEMEIFNLGTGNGYTVLETIAMFEQVSGLSLHYEITDRRPGDVSAIYANNEKARAVLGWTPAYSLEDMMRTAWAWEQKINQQH